MMGLTPAEATKVLRVPFEGTVELGLSPYIIRAIRYAEENKFDALILDIDTFGGRVDAAVEIRDALLDAKVPTVAWVNKRAISAGALISLACRKIFFSPGSTMGAATPIQAGADGAKDVEKKFVSYFRSEMGATAEKNGRSRVIAESMVQAVEDIPKLVAKGEVLTLTDVSALTTKISDGTADNFDKVISFLSLEGSEIEVFKINWAEKIVRFITDPTVSGLLMSGGVLGIILEIQSPGFGLPGVLGIGCLALYFFGKFIVHLAGWEELLFLMLGIFLIGAELLFLPGFILPGITGLLFLIGALFFSGISPKIPLDLSFPHVESQLRSMAIGSILVVLGAVTMYRLGLRYSRKIPMVLDSALPSGAGRSSEDELELKSLLGKNARLLTDLKPTGRAEIEGKTYEVVSESGFLENGLAAKVIDVSGVRIVVSSRINSSPRSS